MKQSKLGISVGLLGAAVYFAGLFSGYLAVFLLTGYILLFEENDWLRKSAVKAVAVMIVFSLLALIINFIPDVIYFIDDVFSIFGGRFSITFLTKLTTAIVSAIDIIEKVTLLILGLKAINQGTVSVPVVDRLIAKYFG